MKNSGTAGIIIIGNEILSGKVQDLNSFFLVTELRKLGVNVRRISVIPDETDIIGKETLAFSNSYEYVFTSGGVGPTHDDVTMEGIAEGFGVKLIRHDGIKKILLSRYQKELNAALLKMTEVPEGAEVILHNNMRFPVVSYKNIFIFPGIPEYVKNKFTAIKERFRSSAFYLRRIFLKVHESDIADKLNRIVEENSDVMFGSYPTIGNDAYRVIVTAESKSEPLLEGAVSDFLKTIPEDLIVKVE
jgi:molybdenum cofactor synthesis domain-containing protein